MSTLESIFGLGNVLQLFSYAFNKRERRKSLKLPRDVPQYISTGKMARNLHEIQCVWTTKEHLVTLNIINIWQMPVVWSHLEIQARTLPKTVGCPTAHSCHTGTSICMHRREGTALTFSGLSQGSWQNEELQVSWSKIVCFCFLVSGLWVLNSPWVNSYHWTSPLLHTTGAMHFLPHFYFVGPDRSTATALSILQPFLICKSLIFFQWGCRLPRKAVKWTAIKTATCYRRTCRNWVVLVAFSGSLRSTLRCRGF